LIYFANFAESLMLQNVSLILRDGEQK